MLLVHEDDQDLILGQAAPLSISTHPTRVGQREKKTSSGIISDSLAGGMTIVSDTVQSRSSSRDN